MRTWRKREGGGGHTFRDALAYLWRLEGVFLGEDNVQEKDTALENTGRVVIGLVVWYHGDRGRAPDDMTATLPGIQTLAGP